jgi:hypothetical protein
MVAYSKTLQRSIVLDKQEDCEVVSHDGGVFKLRYVMTLNGKERYIITTQAGSITEVIEGGR